jgi:hypothetical protein
LVGRCPAIIYFLLMRFFYLTGRGGLLWLLLGLLLGGATTAHAQTWQQAIAGHYNQPPSSGSSYNVHTATDAEGNVFVTGRFTGGITVGNIRLGDRSGNYLFVGKWSPTANAWLWATTDTGINGAYGNAIAVSGHNVYVAGSFNGTTTIAGQTLTAAKANTSSNSDIFLAKYVDQGTSFSNGWAVRGGGTSGDGANGLAVVGNKLYLTGSFAGTASIAGQTVTGVNGYADMFLAKYLDAGTSATPGWVTTSGGTTDDYGTRVVATADGTIYAAGGFTGTATVGGQLLTSAGGSDNYLLKGTDQGTAFAPTWVTRNGGPGADSSTDLALVGTSLYTTGSFTGTATLAGQPLTSKGGSDLYVAKYTDLGSTVAGVWALAEGGTGTDEATTLAVGGTTLYLGGSFYGAATVAGRTLAAASSTDTDGLVACYTDLGTRPTPVWAASYGGPSNDGARGLLLSGTGALYALVNVSYSGADFATSPPTSAPSNSAALLTLAPATGAVLGAAAPYQGGESAVRALARNAAGDVYLAGEFTGTVGFGSIQLVAQGTKDLFLAKWSAATGTWAWARAGGGRSSATTQVQALAVSGNNLYLTGSFDNSVVLAGQRLTVGSGYRPDIFLAKYVDLGTSAGDGWAIGAGGYDSDNSYAVVASGNSVYIAGSFIGPVTVAGQALQSNGNVISDFFVAKYTDQGSSATGVWAASGGGTGTDHAYGLALNGTSVYVVGDYFGGAASVIAGQPLAQAESFNYNGFLAKYVDQGSTYANGWVTSLGGPTGTDMCKGVAAVGPSLYVTGSFEATATVAGQALTSAGDRDVFVAKYTDQGPGVAGVWATSGGPSYDMPTAIASNGTSVYVTGAYGPSGTFAGQPLTAAGFADIFVAKYTDQGPSVANGWAVGAGGSSPDYSYALALTDGGVYVGGSLIPGVTVGPTTFTSPSGATLNFLGQLRDDTPAPLPVQLAAFAAAPLGPTAVRLSWATATEVNSARFEVERSLDGYRFAHIGRVPAAGSSHAPRSYGLTDAALPAGASLLYYRLRQVDQDGTATYSPVRSVGLAPATGLALYPNPAQAATTLLGAAPGAAVRLLDALGREVATATADASGHAYLHWPAGLAQGVYVVRAAGQVARLVIE